MANEADDQPTPTKMPDLSRRELIQGALAVGGLGTALSWNRPLVETVMGGVSKPSTCLCSGSLPPAPPCDSFGRCVNHAQAITFGGKGTCGGSMCRKSGRKCVNESTWTCVDHAWRRDKTTAVGCG